MTNVIIPQPLAIDAHTAAKIRYMYEHHCATNVADRDNRHESTRKRAAKSAGKAQGIWDTLNMLGIQIEGVNAE